MQASRWRTPWTAVPVTLALVVGVGVAAAVAASADDTDRYDTTIVGQQDGRCLDAGGAQNRAGTPVRQSPCTGSAAQTWTQAPDAGTAGMTTVDYPASTATVANPERGFMHFADCAGTALSADSLAKYRADGISLVFCMVYLKSFRTSDIDAATLQLLQRQFAAIRTAGLKTVLRFAYTDSEAGDDAAPSQVLRHIAQLKPYLRDNADVIATVQSGFIGAWGEWYYTRNFGNQGQVSAADRANRKAVVDALLDALPSSRMVQLRTPAFKRTLYGAEALTADRAYGGTANARVGHHNDCFLASADDMGTYADAGVERPYLAAETAYLVMGGETCAVSPPRSQCATALSELGQFHWSYLNADYHPDVLASWRSGGCMAEVRQRLGYRLTLVRGSFSDTARAGEGLRVRLDIRNDGWAAPFNPRLVQLVLHDGSGGTSRLALTADPRRWLPGTTTTVDQTVTVPADLAAGSYQLSLALPDPSSTVAARPEYAIQTANTGLWDATGGYNNLRHTLTVTR